jgi:hypothetical protein
MHVSSPRFFVPKLETGIDLNGKLWGPLAGLKINRVEGAQATQA